MIKTTIYLHRIGERLYARDCDLIAEFDIINEPDDEYIGKIIKQKFGFEMKKSEVESNSFVTEDGRIEVRYHNYKRVN